MQQGVQQYDWSFYVYKEHLDICWLKLSVIQMLLDCFLMEGA